MKDELARLEAEYKASAEKLQIARDRQLRLEGAILQLRDMIAKADGDADDNV